MLFMYECESSNAVAGSITVGRVWYKGGISFPSALRVILILAQWKKFVLSSVPDPLLVLL